MMDMVEAIRQVREVFKPDTYFEAYPKHFNRYIGTDVHVLEIGVYRGGSLELWRDFFGPEAMIYGVDWEDKGLDVEDEQIEILIADVNKAGSMEMIKTEFPRVDIVIDDCGHDMDQQKRLFMNLYPHVSPNGIWVTEDVYTSYWGSLYNPTGERTFIEYTKDLIDELMAVRKPDHSLEGVTDFTLSAGSIHYYPGLFIVEKQVRRIADLVV